MDLGKRIAILFIANHVEHFKQWLKDETLSCDINLDYLGSAVMDTANELNISPDYVLRNPFEMVAKNKDHTGYSHFKQRIHVDSFIFG